MVNMGERVIVIENDIKYIRKKLDKFVDSADKKFASKLTERIVYGTVTLILIAFVTKLTGLWDKILGWIKW